MWEKYWANEHSLIKEHAVHPKTLLGPVGSCVHVREGQGIQVGKESWLCVPAYVIPEHVERIERMCKLYPGWALYVSEPLSEREWRRGWADTYYRYTDKPMIRWYLPGMVKVEFRMTDIELAAETIRANKDIPVCPTCTLEQYEDKTGRIVFDEARRLFIHYWLYGEPTR